ncbi:MAG: alpha-L-fucosidase [Lachnospiraceae bacterium]|nr:alpha-L-fucosidase [Lachnospiraceae bacterium]
MDVSKYTKIKPTNRQVEWQKLGFTAFLHFGINTFTNHEWGTGDENPELFRPHKLNTDQWCEALKAAGVKACILTAKHHDGFCLWATEYTDYSVMASPYPRDIVALLRKSCDRYGLKMGLYLSPWDRHEAAYGTGKAYDDFYLGQLLELTANYGELYTIWMDGACGEGANGKVQEYDWERYFALIRKNQPNAVISIMGPDVRWIGNEAGITRKSEWSVVSERLRERSAIAARSQQAAGIKPLSPEDEDIGSIAALMGEEKLCWYPAEVDVSIRPGWFYHPEENNDLRTTGELVHIYETSVGGNALLLLNVPPDMEGLINEVDVKRLKELGAALKAIFAENLCADACVYDEQSAPITAVLHDDEDFWCGRTEKETVTVKFPEKRRLTHLVLCEQIRESQRIESFDVYSVDLDGQRLLYSGTTVGFKKICRFGATFVEELKIVITQSREFPTIRFIGAYCERI